MPSLAVRMYANEPCRICGQLITVDQVSGGVFVGYNEDCTARAAHGDCWRNAPQDVINALLAQHNKNLQVYDNQRT